MVRFGVLPAVVAVDQRPPLLPLRALGSVAVLRGPVRVAPCFPPSGLAFRCVVLAAPLLAAGVREGSSFLAAYAVLVVLAVLVAVLALAAASAAAVLGPAVAVLGRARPLREDTPSGI